MNPVQKLVKLAAMIFAVILAVSIVSAIIGSILGAMGFLLPNQSGQDGENSSSLISEDYRFDDVRELKVRSEVADIMIVSSTDKNQDAVVVRLDEVDESHEVTLRDGVLQIESDKGTGVLSLLGNVFDGDETVEGVIKVVVPSELFIENIEVETGYGMLEMKGLHSERLKISTNTGEIKCEQVFAKDVLAEMEISKASFKNCKFSDAEIMGGADDFVFEGMLLGDCKIKGNIGKMEFDFDMEPEDCALDITDGMGNVYIDGEKYDENKYERGSSENHIEVDVGIGNMRFNFN